MEWLEAMFITFLILGIGGGFLALMIIAFVSGVTGDFDTAFNKTKTPLIAIGIILFVIITPLIHGTLVPSGGSSGKHYGSSSNSSSAHECYVCGDNAYKKYGAYYYCSEHYDLVKATYEALND